MAFRTVGWSVALLLAVACGGDDDGRPMDMGTDAGAVTPGTDAGSVTPGADAGSVTPGTDAGTPPSLDAGAPPEGRTTTAPPEAVEQLVGTFALESRFATISMVPFLGDQHSVSTAWGLVTIEQVGETLQMTERGCHVETEGGSTMTTIPDAVPQSIPPRVATLEFLSEGGSLRWFRPEVAVAVGWEASSPADMLPQSADDPRVVDADGDGNPGVTVSISGLASGDVYVVQWQRGWYEGTLGGGAGTLTGQNHGGGSEQKTIGASNSILEMDVPQRPDPDTSDNTLQLVPVDAGMDCAGLIAAGDGLF